MKVNRIPSHTFYIDSSLRVFGMGQYLFNIGFCYDSSFCFLSDTSISRQPNGGMDSSMSERTQNRWMSYKRFYWSSTTTMVVVEWFQSVERHHRKSRNANKTEILANVLFSCMRVVCSILWTCFMYFWISFRLSEIRSLQVFFHNLRNQNISFWHENHQ